MRSKLAPGRPAAKPLLPPDEILFAAVERRFPLGQELLSLGDDRSGRVQVFVDDCGEYRRRIQGMPATARTVAGGEQVLPNEEAEKLSVSSTG